MRQRAAEPRGSARVGEARLGGAHREVDYRAREQLLLLLLRRRRARLGLGPRRRQRVVQLPALAQRGCVLAAADELADEAVLQRVGRRGRPPARRRGAQQRERARRQRQQRGAVGAARGAGGVQVVRRGVGHRHRPLGIDGAGALAGGGPIELLRDGRERRAQGAPPGRGQR